jgi:hypothetical protein
MKHLLFITLFSTLPAVVLAEAAVPDIKEGLWELTFKSEIAAQPTPMPAVAYSSQHCLTKQSAGDPHTLLQNNQCEISDFKLQANHAAWKMRCQQQGIQMTGDGQANYTYESINSTFNMYMQGEGAQSLKITTQTTGRYLGNCK